MKKLSLLLFLLMPFILLGQKVKLTSVKVKNDSFSEEYTVQKSNPKILHGRYKKFFSDKNPDIEGFYKNGKKDSVWTEYWYSGKKIAEGKYINDNRIGIWEFFDVNGEVEQRYDFSKNELVYFRLPETEKYKFLRIVNSPDTISVQLERPPVFLGGSALFSKALTSEIRYPMDAMRIGTTGKVFITFLVDKEGKAKNYKIIRGLGDGCDEEALRVVKGLGDNWIPGIFKGETVTTEFLLPISFRFN